MAPLGAISSFQTAWAVIGEGDMQIMANIAAYSAGIRSEDILEVLRWTMDFITAGVDLDFSIEEKVHPFKKHDLCTSIEKAIHAKHARDFASRFPGFCHLSEEGSGAVPNGPYVTDDPIDGTDDFTRGDLSRVSTMLSFVEDGRVRGVGIGIPVIGEMFVYADDLPEPHMFYQAGGSMRVSGFRDCASAKAFPLLLRRPLDAHSAAVQSLADRSTEVLDDERGSLGVWITRLWLGEYRCGVLPTDSLVTPWDSTPIFAMSERLGFSFFRVTDDGVAFEGCQPEYPVDSRPRPREVLIVHTDDLSRIAGLVRA